jgi:hypothetical protein
LRCPDVTNPNADLRVKNVRQSARENGKGGNVLKKVNVEEKRENVKRRADS